MKKENCYLSTIASDAVPAAKEYGVNLEIAEYCTAWNMDDEFATVDPVVRNKLTQCPKSLLHAPFAAKLLIHHGHITIFTRVAAPFALRQGFPETFTGAEYVSGLIFQIFSTDISAAFGAIQRSQ